MNHRLQYRDDYTSVRESFEASLKELDLEYIDLYLIHWPQRRLVSTDAGNQDVMILDRVS